MLSEVSMPVRIRQECGLNELTLMKKKWKKINQALCSLLTGTGIAVHFSSKCSHWKPHTWVHNTYQHSAYKPQSFQPTTTGEN